MAGKKIPKGAIPSNANTVRAWLFEDIPFYSLSKIFSTVIGLNLIIHIIHFPLPLVAIGEYMLCLRPDMYISAVKNLFFAKLLTNVYAFIVIAMNYADDNIMCSCLV